jgi:predicted O-methyltransferase YrrM
MPSLKTIFTPVAYSNFANRLKQAGDHRITEGNWNAISGFPPGHFYSTLLDVDKVSLDRPLPFDGVEMWENIALRAEEQKELYRELLQAYPRLPFPTDKSDDFRYYVNNPFFCESDAYTLSAILRHTKPKRIVEVGSGFSSAVMLDTLDYANLSAEISFIEPYADRLKSLLSLSDRAVSTILEEPVQAVPLEVFEMLQRGDILFIDSSHVAKIGSDVAHLILRVLPVIQPGVWIHVHDIFYPSSYPTAWIKEGRAWNESLFLRAYLTQNTKVDISAFNSFAGSTFPEIFQSAAPSFLTNAGGSIWMKTVG